MSRRSTRLRLCPLGCDGTARAVWHEAGHRYMRCGMCGVVFADLTEVQYLGQRHNVWDDDDLKPETIRFYRDEREAPHTRFLDDIERRRQSGALLDVGCGLGVFLERAADRGWDVYGCDTSAPWVERAQAVVDPNRVICSEPTRDMFGDRRFDLITLWDVIEHIYDPVSMLQAIRHLLKPGGEVFVRTPNVKYVLPVYRARRALGRRVELGPMNHVVYFDAKTLGRALASAGLQPRSWKVYPPPQVRLGGRGWTVRAKNAYAALAGAAADLSRGRIVLGSDLDVLGGADLSPPRA